MATPTEVVQIVTTSDVSHSVLSGAVFWPTLAVLITFLIFTTIRGSGFFSTLALVFVGACIRAKEPNVGSWIAENGIYLVVAGLVYVGISIVWARFQWARFVASRREMFITIRDRFFQKYDLNTSWFTTAKMDHPHVREFVSTVYRNDFGNFQLESTDQTLTDIMPRIIPQAADNKANIIMWMAYWPLYMIWYVFNDMLGDVFRGIYRNIANHFQNVSNAAFKDLT